MKTIIFFIISFLLTVNSFSSIEFITSVQYPKNGTKVYKAPSINESLILVYLNKNYKIETNNIDTEENDRNMEIEFKFYKYISVNNIDNFWFSSDIEKKTVDGWGYPYYNVTEGIMLKNNFIKLNSKDFDTVYKKVYYDTTIRIRYNPKLPIAFYIPKKVYFIYRIWQTNVYKSF